MKSVQISDNDLFGNKFNGYDLHLLLNQKGHDAYHLTSNKLSNDSTTIQLGDTKLSQHLLKNVIQVEAQYLTKCFLSPIAFDVLYNEHFLEAEIVNYQVVHNNMLNLHMLPLMTKLKPSVWTLHDPWLLTARCIHFFDCNKWQDSCVGCQKYKNAALNYELKKQVVQNSDISFIVASEWLKNIAEKSPMLKGKKIYHIPFGINQEIFQPKNKAQVRKELGIKEDSLVLMFRSEESPFKGLEIIKNALRHISSDKKITLLTVSHKGLLKEFKSKFDIIEFGWIYDDLKLSKLYQACDIFLMPSEAESFGFMALEAMCCGKMVLALEGTALPSTINSPACGLATSKEEYASELQKLIDNPEEVEIRGQKSLEYAVKNHNPDVYVDSITKVYQEIINNHQPDAHSEDIVESLKQEMTQYQPLGIRKQYLNKSNFLVKLLYPFFRNFLLYFIDGSILRNYFDIKYDYKG